MRALALLLLLCNAGFFAWQQHLLPWLPWQPEQFQTAQTQEIPEVDEHLQQLVLLDEQPTLARAEPDSHTSPTTQDVAEPPPTASVQPTVTAEATLPKAETDKTPAMSKPSDEQLAAIDADAAPDSPNMIENVFSRIAERASNSKVAAEIPATEAKTTTVAIAPTNKPSTNMPDPTVVAADQPEPVTSVKPTATTLSMASTDDAGAALTETPPVKVAEANTSKPIPLKDVIAASEPKAAVDSKPTSSEPKKESTPVAKAEPAPTPKPKTSTQTAAAPAKTPSQAASTPTPSTASTPDIPVVTQTTGIVCYRLGPYAQASSVYTGINWFQQMSQSSASLSQGGSTLRSTTWVYLPPYGSESAALQAQRQLQQQGISDNYVVQSGAFRYAISLGVYRDPLSVERRLQQLAGKGYHNVRTQVRQETDNNGTTYWLNVKLPASHRALVAQFTRTHPTPKVQVVTCR